MKYIIAILILLSAIGCSDAHKSQQGYKKFIKYGGVVKCDTTLVTVTDTIKGVDGKDSIIYRTINTICPDPVFPPTRYEIRWKYKYDIKLQKLRDAFIIDSMNKVNKLAKIETKQIKSDNRVKKKTITNEKKKGFWYNLRFIAIILGLLLLIFIFFRINKIFK
jgi:hypothetical protein